jgi:hypothetical protein
MTDVRRFGGVFDYATRDALLIVDRCQPYLYYLCCSLMLGFQITPSLPSAISTELRLLSSAVMPFGANNLGHRGNFADGGGSAIFTIEQMCSYQLPR